MYTKYSHKDIYFFFALYAVAIITVYLLPDIVAYIYFGLLIFLFWRSDKNALWFILAFCLLDPPGNLFPQDFNYGLPFIPGINLRFIEVFIYVAFIKAIKQKAKFQTVFLKSYQLLFLLIVLLLLFTALLNTSLISILITVKWLFVWSLVYSIPKLLDKFDDWIFLFRTAFIIVFIGFFSQLLHLVLGHPPSYLFGTDFNPMTVYDDFQLEQLDPHNYDVQEARPLSSSSIVQMAFIGAMFFLKFKKSLFQNNYLLLVIIISYLSILLTATRGWFISFSIALLLYFALVQKSNKTISAIILVLILVPLLLQVPVVRKQLQGSVKRISTVESILRGDISAGGTSARDEYSKVLFKYWSESPILGWGFTDFYKDNGNGHAGLANLLFSVGILGYLIFIYFWYKLFFIPIQTIKRLSITNPFKRSLIVLSIGFLTFFILHSTSGQQFGFYLGFGSGILSQTLFYSFSSYFIMQALKAEGDLAVLHNERST